MLYLKPLISSVVLFAFISACGVSDKVKPGEEEDNSNTNGSLVGKWEGVFESKSSLVGGETTKSQSVLEFKSDSTFILEFKGDNPSSATGTYQDGSDALLFYVKKSNILPEFPANSYVKLKYKMRGKILTLQSDEQNGFTLTKQGGGSDGDNPTPAATGPIGWWSGTDGDGFNWNLNITDNSTFWLQVGRQGSSSTTMTGSTNKQTDSVLLLTVTESENSSLIGRKFRVSLQGNNDMNFEIFDPQASMADPPRSTLALRRR